MSLAGPNVLVSSAGRRFGLVRAFQSAAIRHGGTVIATDREPRLSAACQVADVAVRVPPISDPSFTEETLALALTHNVGLVIPTLDTELDVFASVRSDWLDRGIAVSISDPGLVARCRDKRLTARVFEEIGISPLREVADDFPRFIKPISGSLSKDTHTVRSPLELSPRLMDQSRFIHQELIDNSVYREYTIDALYSTSGELTCAVPRRRLEVRGGEISKGRTEKGRILRLLQPRLARDETHE